MSTSPKKKLIEVALPLPEINDASAYDKMPGIGPHPKGIHQWWARLPLPTARAVLFASVVDDPESHPEKWPTEELQNVERERLFDIIRLLMAKKLHENPEVYTKAREEMLLHCDGVLPAVFDPFAGGGSIPLEANRLGFEAHATDLNPVAVLLNKCNLELAPRWSGCPPVNPEARSRIGGSDNWRGTRGLADDIRYYGRKILKNAQQQIGHLYPKVRLPKERGGGQANVIAWLWARTVASPNPAALGKHVPLITTYWLTTKGQLAYLEPIVDKAAGTYHFGIKTGTPDDRVAVSAGTKLGRGAKFKCLLTDEPIEDAHIKSEAKAGKLGVRLLAIVAEGQRTRTYLPAEPDHEKFATTPLPADYPAEPLAYDSRYLTPPGYGMTSIDKLFTPRQLTSLVTLGDLVKLIGAEVERDAVVAGLTRNDASEYAQTLTTFLALVLDRCSDFNNALCRWKPSGEQLMQLFGRQAIPMVWDFAESNIMGERGVCWLTAVDICADALETLVVGTEKPGIARQLDAATGANGIANLLVSTDPPYYDNVPYADISDFFYVWLRRTVGTLYPELFSTMLVPKMPELTASPQRFSGDKERAKEHFESGFRKAFTALAEKVDPKFPLTVYYAFKQDDEESMAPPEGDNNGVDLTTGWETLLEALISSKFQITATWPVRASQKWRMRAMGSNALASYIVLSCRRRSDDAPRISSLQFRQELKSAMPSAVKHLQQGNVAPVDFAQAALGPGMAIYSKYSSILESSGTRLSVRAALGLINQILTEVLNEQEDEFDGETRWAIAWFEQYGFGTGSFGDAELLSKAKVTSDSALQNSGLVISGAGEVRLKRPEELPEDWDHAESQHTVWGMTHHLIRIYCHDKAGDEAAATLLRHFSSKADLARDLALRLFRISEKKGLLLEAQAYNALGLGWSEIARLAQKAGPSPEPEQGKLI